MKTIIIVSAFLFLGATLVPIERVINGEQDLCIIQNKNEEFFIFFEKFCVDKVFQYSRIKFPLMIVKYNEEYTELDTFYIQPNAWVFRQFYFSPNNISFGQVYDNFEHKLRDTDERVFAWHGIGNGIQNFLYFKRINGDWYLIKEEDLSS
jgi:hypothetical protein